MRSAARESTSAPGRGSKSVMERSDFPAARLLCEHGGEQCGVASGQGARRRIENRRHVNQRHAWPKQAKRVHGQAIAAACVNRAENRRMSVRNGLPAAKLLGTD